MTKHTETNSRFIRHGRWVAQPARIHKEGLTTTVFTNPLDPERRSLDAIDLYNALITTYVVKRHQLDEQESYQTAITFSEDLHVSVQNTNPELGIFIKQLESIKQTSALLTPMVAFLANKHFQHSKLSREKTNKKVSEKILS